MIELKQNINKDCFHKDLVIVFELGKRDSLKLNFLKPLFKKLTEIDKIMIILKIGLEYYFLNQNFVMCFQPVKDYYLENICTPETFAKADLPDFKACNFAQFQEKIFKTYTLQPFKNKSLQFLFLVNNFEGC